MLPKKSTTDLIDTRMEVGCKDTAYGDRNVGNQFRGDNLNVSCRNLQYFDDFVPKSCKCPFPKGHLATYGFLERNRESIP